MQIDAKTELVGIIGYSMDYTLSPAIHNAAFRILEMNWLYLPLRVIPGGVKTAVDGLRALGFRGANVTIPHKVDAALCMDELRGEAEVLNAVNTIVCEREGLFGYNTDVKGFRAFLQEQEIRLSGSSVMLVGAGGASRAVALALAQEGAAHIFIFNRTPERAHELAALLKRVTSTTEISVRKFDLEGSRVLKECEMVVNCTPLGNTASSDLPMDYTALSPSMWAVDLNYAKAESAFLKEASARGAKTTDGEGMLIHQAAASFELWTGRSAPLEEMRAAYHRAAGGKQAREIAEDAKT